MTLTDFLLARIAEDEAVAKASLETGYQPPAWGPEDQPEFIPDFYEPPTDADRKRVARVLAECEAKRRVVETSGAAVAHRCGQYHGDDFETILALLALPYANHPDYRQEWRPHVSETPAPPPPRMPPPLPNPVVPNRRKDVPPPSA